MPDMEKKYVLGVDIGGQTAKCGLVDENGKVLAQSVIPSNQHTVAAGFVAALATALKALVKEAGVEGQVRGIGVGAPDANYYTGIIEHAVNLTWAGVNPTPFAKMLTEQMDGMPVALTNDANAAAMGEMMYGVAKGMKNFIMITLGTGVGSGIIIDGKVVYGHDGFAGELGHVIAVRDGRQCGCGRKGCLEAYTSATGVARTAREWLDTSDEPSLLRKLDKITSKDVYDAAKEGDKLALRVFDFTGKLMGQCFADFIAFSAPEAIVLFGGLTKAREFLEKPILESMEENTLSMWKGKVKLLFSQLKESDAAILGASALAWEF